MKSRKEVIKLKIAVTGSPSSGKTTLIKRLIDHKYNKQPLQTEQYEVYLHCLSTKTTDLEVQLWDCSTHHFDFHKYLREAFFRNSSAALLIFDISNPNWKEQADNWITQIYENQCYLVHAIATKMDLAVSTNNKHQTLSQPLIDTLDTQLKEDAMTFFKQYDIKVHFQSLKQTLKPGLENLFPNIHYENQTISRSTFLKGFPYKNNSEQLINDTISIFEEQQQTE